MKIYNPHKWVEEYFFNRCKNCESVIKKNQSQDSGLSHLI